MILRETASLLTLWVIAREGRQIFCRPHAVTGAVRVSTGPLVPPGLLACTIPVSDGLEDPACR